MQEKKGTQFALVILVVILPFATAMFYCAAFWSRTETATHLDHFSIVDPITGSLVQFAQPDERLTTYYGWPLAYNSNYGWFSLFALVVNLSIAFALAITARRAISTKLSTTIDFSTKSMSAMIFTAMSIFNFTIGGSAIAAIPVAVYVNVVREGMPFSSWIGILISLLAMQGIVLMWSGWRWSLGRWRTSLLVNIITFLGFVGCDAISQSIW